jgi:DNA mismatch repair ATPase MutS
MIISHKLVTRYRELKQDVSDCILLMQVGAFMQVMGEDAQAVSDLTDLKLQMGGAVDAPMVIGGFPYTGLDKYTGKLVRAGYSVAIALQDDVKERHIREIMRVQIEKKFWSTLLRRIIIIFSNASKLCYN